jgi:hypothetical protein
MKTKDPNIVKCQGCGVPVKWTGLYGDWCSLCKPRDVNTHALHTEYHKESHGHQHH